MKALQYKLLLGLLAGSGHLAAATTRYVDLNNPSPTPPYASWSTAATNIQDAIDSAVDGDLVLVTNGVYQTGGRAVFGTMTNRVVVSKALTLQSANGARLTAIVGAAASGGGNGDGAVRCVLLTSNSVLTGFTVTGGYTRTAGDAVNELNGGGVWCEPGALVRKSILVSNSASGDGGGVYRGRLQNCELTWNSAAYGGGAQGSALFNCTVLRNSSTSRSLGAGVALATCVNSIVQLNRYSGNSDNYSQSAFSFSSTTPLPMGGGNFTNLPVFVDLEAGLLRLRCGSAGIDAGTNLAGLFTDDLRGHVRPVDGDGDSLATFDLGAYERDPAYDAEDVGIRAAFTNFALQFPAAFFGQIDGCPSNFWWDFADGSTVTNQYAVVHGWAAPGDYPVRLIAQFGASGSTGMATSLVHVVTANYYVNQANPFPVHPYTNWSVAATNIQDAVEAGSALGRSVFVTNGLYQNGGLALHGQMTNRVALTNGVRLQSLNGPGVTFILGAAAAGGGTGAGAVRGLYVDKLSMVDGFTITNGHTLEAMVSDTRLYDGGGLWCEAGATITNCVITGNAADFYAGGVYQGNLHRCVLTGNSGYYGGGAAYAVLINCLIQSNSTYSAEGGGAIFSSLTNCTVVGNSVPWWSSTGGIKGCSVFNSIVYHNSPGNFGGVTPSSFSFSCTTPMPAGVGNIADLPLFVDLVTGDIRLQSNSPCLNAGSKAYVPSSIDLAGNPRVAGGRVDLGAYEFQSPSSVLSYAWAQQNGLPTDGSADFTDADGDGMDNYGEWHADTIPTNLLSVLRMVNATNSLAGAQVTWQSVATRNYWLERATNLGVASPFQIVSNNIAGASGTKTVTDTTATNAGPYFYRVGVQ